MVADITGPGVGERVETLLLLGEEGTGSFFKVWEITGNRGHEPVRHFLRPPYTILHGMSLPGFVDEFAEGDRRPAGLCGKPLPMPGEERDFAGDDPEPWTAPRAGFVGLGLSCCGGLDAGADFSRSATKVELDLFSRRIVEDEDGIRGVTVEMFFNFSGHVDYGAGGDEAMGGEGGAGR
jgi:hypothetical protein